MRLAREVRLRLAGMADHEASRERDESSDDASTPDAIATDEIAADDTAADVIAADVIAAKADAIAAVAGAKLEDTAQSAAAEVESAAVEALAAARNAKADTMPARAGSAAADASDTLTEATEQIADTVASAADELAATAAHAAESVDQLIDQVTDAPPPGRISRFDYQGAILVAEEHDFGGTTAAEISIGTETGITAGTGTTTGTGSATGTGTTTGTGVAAGTDTTSATGTATGTDITFVLVHGIGMGRKVFGDLTRILTAHGRVIAIDQPGYGEAPEPPRTPTIERTADHVAALIRDRGLEHAVLIGHSMGTQVVAEVAARHPYLAGPLVLVAPTVDPAARTAPRQLVRLAHDLLAESPKVFLLGAREYLRAGPHLRRKMHAMLVHRPENTYPRISARALVLRGADDPVSPRSWARRVADLIPDSAYTEIEDHGHETMIRDASPAAERIIAFLSEGDRAQRR